MFCRDVEQNEVAVKYLAGELDPELGEDFEVHLLKCGRCQTTLKTLLLMREGLEARAHEIRAYPLPSRRFLRRGWTAVAAMAVLVFVAGLLEIPKMHHQHLVQTAQTQSPVSINPVPQVIETPRVSGCRTDCDIEAIPIIQSPKNLSAGTSKRRNYIDFTLTDSQMARADAPNTGAAPTSRLNMSGQRARSNVVNVDGADATDNSVNGVRSTPSSADGSPSKARRASDSNAAASAENPPVFAGNQKPLKNDPTPNLLSDEGEKELFRLATTNAPPYTFAGFARYAKDTPSYAGATGAQAGGLTAPNGKRPAFQDAMLAYVNGDYKRAQYLLERALTQEPPAPDAYFYLGICRLVEGDAAGSIAPFKSALDYPKSPILQSAHYFLAKAYLHTRDYTSAEAELQAAASQIGEWTRSAQDDLAMLQALREREGQ